MFQFLGALAPAAAANAATGLATGAAAGTVGTVVGSVVSGLGRIVAGAVITKVGADLARPALERMVTTGVRLVART